MAPVGTPWESDLRYYKARAKAPTKRQRLISEHKMAMGELMKAIDETYNDLHTLQGSITRWSDTYHRLNQEVVREEPVESERRRLTSLLLAVKYKKAKKRERALLRTRTQLEEELSDVVKTLAALEAVGAGQAPASSPKAGGRSGQQGGQEHHVKGMTGAEVEVLWAARRAGGGYTRKYDPVLERAVAEVLGEGPDSDWEDTEGGAAGAGLHRLGGLGLGRVQPASSSATPAANAAPEGSPGQAGHTAHVGGAQGQQERAGSAIRISQDLTGFSVVNGEGGGTGAATAAAAAAHAARSPAAGVQGQEEATQSAGAKGGVGRNLSFQAWRTLGLLDASLHPSRDVAVSPASLVRGHQAQVSAEPQLRPQTHKYAHTTQPGPSTPSNPRGYGWGLTHGGEGAAAGEPATPTTRPLSARDRADQQTSPPSPWCASLNAPYATDYPPSSPTAPSPRSGGRRASTARAAHATSQWQSPGQQAGISVPGDEFTALAEKARAAAARFYERSGGGASPTRYLPASRAAAAAAGLDTAADATAPSPKQVASTPSHPYSNVTAPTAQQYGAVAGAYGPPPPSSPRSPTNKPVSQARGESGLRASAAPVGPGVSSRKADRWEELEAQILRELSALRDANRSVVRVLRDAAHGMDDVIAAAAGHSPRKEHARGAGNGARQATSGSAGSRRGARGELAALQAEVAALRKALTTERMDRLHAQELAGRERAALLARIAGEVHELAQQEEL